VKKIIALILSGGILLQSPLSAVSKPKPEIDLKSKFNDSLSSEYFGFVGFDIQNNTKEWQHVTEVSVSYPDSVYEQTTYVVAGKQLQAWNEAMSHKQAVKDFWWGVALGGIAAIGGAAAGMSRDPNVQAAGVIAASGALATASTKGLGRVVNSLRFAALVPESHLLGGDFYIPPEMMTQKWILFYTKHDEKTPMLRRVKITLTMEDKKTREFPVELLSLDRNTTPPWQSSIWKRVRGDKQALKAGCSEDLNRFCKTISSSDFIFPCLAPHEEALSDSCKAALR
jgi:hypothetical protein